MAEENKTEKKPYEVTPLGSLGLLALGDVGLQAWRKARAEAGEKLPEWAVLKEDQSEEKEAK